MKKWAMIVDSSYNIEENEYDNVYVLPLVISVATKESQKDYFDNIDINNQQLCQFLNNGADVKTSQPIPGKFLELTEKLSKEYENVYCFPITQTLSGTYNTWKNMVSEFNNVRVYDQRMVGAISKWMIKDLINQKDNLTDQYINKYLENTLNTRAGAVIVPDITQLKKGGRVSNFKSIFIKLLGLKLIITLDKNGLLFKDKAGKLESAVDTNLVELDKILSYSTKKIKRALLLYNDCKNEKFNINEMIKLTENKFPNIKFEKTVLPAVITAHLGPNYFAVAFDVE